MSSETKIRVAAERPVNWIYRFRSYQELVRSVEWAAMSPRERTEAELYFCVGRAS